MSILCKLSELKKDIEYFLDVEKKDIEDIPPMRYEEGEQPTYVPPVAQVHGQRMRYRR